MKKNINPVKDYPILVKLLTLTKENDNLVEIENFIIDNNEIHYEVKPTKENELYFWEIAVLDFINSLISLKQNKLYFRLLKLYDVVINDQGIIINNYENIQEQEISFSWIIDFLTDLEIKIVEMKKYEYKNFIIELKKEKVKTLQQIKDQINKKKYKLFPQQLQQINDGLSDGLSQEEINIYANAVYNSKQMGIIKHALLENMNKGDIEIFCNHNFSSRQMYQIKVGIENGLSVKLVKSYANIQFNSWEMTLIRINLEKGNSLSKIKKDFVFYYHLINENYFSSEQINKIKRTFYLNLDNYQKEIIANPLLSSEEMEQLIKVFCFKKVNLNDYPNFHLKTNDLNKTWDFYQAIFSYKKEKNSTKTKYIFKNDHSFFVIEKNKENTQNANFKIRVKSKEVVNKLFEIYTKKYIFEKPKNITEILYGGCLIDENNNQIFIYCF